MQDPIARVHGVGGVQVFGSQYAMRIWLDPAKLLSYNLMPSDIRAAIESQNSQVSAGKIGGMPSADSQQLNATVTAQSQAANTRPIPRHHRQARLRAARRCASATSLASSWAARATTPCHALEWPSRIGPGGQARARRERAHHG